MTSQTSARERERLEARQRMFTVVTGGLVMVALVGAVVIGMSSRVGLLAASVVGAWLLVTTLMSTQAVSRRRALRRRTGPRASKTRRRVPAPSAAPEG